MSYVVARIREDAEDFEMKNFEYVASFTTRAAANERLAEEEANNPGYSYKVFAYHAWVDRFD
jgi:hypothetical protein